MPSSDGQDDLLGRLQESEERLRGLSDATFEAIFLSVRGVCIDANKAAERLLGFTHEEFIGIFGTDVITPEFKEVVKRNMLAGNEEPYEAAAVCKDGSTFPCEIQARMTHFRGRTVRVTALRDISARKKVEAELERHREHLEELVEQRTAELMETRDRLVQSSRKAGMADIASSVLHNVGNALNGVTVSVGMIREGLSDSKLGGVQKVMELVDANSDDLGGFFTADPRGQKALQYLHQLGTTLTQEQRDALELMGELEMRVHQIEAIVESQQAYAAADSFSEPCDLREVVADAIQIHRAALPQPGGTLASDLDSLPRVSVDKHRIIHILIALLSNAEQARDEAKAGEHSIAVRLKAEGTDALIQVEDNGVGIGPDDLEQMFSSTFSTRGEGHGFGLHNSANAANSMGWKLAARSDGQGQGATFELRIPVA